MEWIPIVALIAAMTIVLLAQFVVLPVALAFAMIRVAGKVREPAVAPASRTIPEPIRTTPTPLQQLHGNTVHALQFTGSASPDRAKSPANSRALPPYYLAGYAETHL